MSGAAGGGARPGAPGSGTGDEAGMSADPPPLIPDHTLLRRLDAGSYGAVWLARNVMGQFRAVKVIHRRRFEHAEPYDREWRGIGRYEPVSRTHPNQLGILHIGRNDGAGFFYYVMELADGMDAGPDDTGRYQPKTLAALLRREGRLPVASCLEIASALADAVGHLHGHGLVHRDLKPANVVFVHGLPKLADLGMVTDSSATQTSVGSQGYMPPEGPGRAAGDLFSLGKILYEMVTGQDRLKFPELPGDFGSWPDRLAVNELMAISERACEPDLADRYVSALQMQEDLLQLRAGKSILRQRRLERGLRVLGGLVVVALALAAAGWAVARVKIREETLMRGASLVREAQSARLVPHQAGWSATALSKLAAAARIRSDPEVRDQAAASLAGLDSSGGVIEEADAWQVAFDARGERLLAHGGPGGASRVWLTGEGRPVRVASQGQGPLAFDDRGHVLEMHHTGEGRMLLRDTDENLTLSAFRLPGVTTEPTIRTNAWRFSPGARFVVAAWRGPAAEGGFGLWAVPTGTLVTNVMERVALAEFTPDGRFLATADDDGRVQVRTAPGLRGLLEFRATPGATRSLAFGRDARRPQVPRAEPIPWYLAVGDAFGSVTVYDLTAPGRYSVLAGLHYEVLALAFSPDGSTLASSGRYEVKFWEFRMGRSLLSVALWDGAGALAWSPGGDRLAVGTRTAQQKGKLGLLRLEPDRGVMSLRGLSAQAGHTAFSHDSRRVAGLSHRWEIGMWRLADRTLEHVFEGHVGVEADNAGLAFSPDDRSLAFATTGGAQLWDLASGGLQREWPLPRGLGQALRFTQQGRLLLFQRARGAGDDALVGGLYDLLRTNWAEPLLELREPSGDFYRAEFTEDGATLVLAGANRGAPPRAVMLSVDTRSLRISRLEHPLNSPHPDFVLLARGQSVLYWPASISKAAEYELPGLRLWREPVRFVSASAPVGAVTATTLDELGGILIERAGSADGAFVVGANQLIGERPRFSPDGRYVAWGTGEGVVQVADLPEIERQLKKVLGPFQGVGAHH